MVEFYFVLSVRRPTIFPLPSRSYLGHKCGANTFSNYLMVAYQCVPSSSIHDICESTFHVSDNNGFIISPGYPSPYYKGIPSTILIQFRVLDVDLRIVSQLTEPQMRKDF